MIFAQCHICGRPASRVCKLCGRATCDIHLHNGICESCMQGRRLKYMVW